MGGTAPVRFFPVLLTPQGHPPTSPKTLGSVMVLALTRTRSADRQRGLLYSEWLGPGEKKVKENIERKKKTFTLTCRSRAFGPMGKVSVSTIPQDWDLNCIHT